MKWLKEKIESNEKVNLEMVIEKNGQDFPLLLEFKNTEQDPEWHAEGDVHIHTNMVIEEMYKIFEENNFSNKDKYILLMSAIFHDIAKPVTTRRKEIMGIERVTASNHEYEGLSYLYYRFLEIDITKEDREHILELVGFHQYPKKLVIFEEGNPEYAFKLLTENTSGKYFYFLELADMRGRETIDYDEQIEYMELFKEYCLEFNCFETNSNIDKEIRNTILAVYPEETESSLSYLIGKTKKRWSEGNKVDPHVIYNKYYEHKDNYSNFYVLCGLSGSGKSTVVKELTSKNDNIKIVELDQLRLKHKEKRNNRREIDGKVRQESKELIKQYLREGYDVIFDACNLRKDFRKIVCDLAEEYYAKTILILMDTPLSQCIKNDRDRTIRTVGEQIIYNQRKSFQYPVNSEFNEINKKPS